MRYFFSILLILISTISFAQGVPFPGCGVMSGTNAASCTTQAAPTDMETYNSNVFQPFAGGAVIWHSSQFTAGETTTICQACVYAKSSTGTSPTYTVTAYIYSDDGSNEPNISLGTLQAKDMTGVLTSDFQWICWTGAGTASVTNETKYHIVLKSSTYDGTNIFYWGKDSTCASEFVYYSGDGSSWTSASSTVCGMLKLYK